MQVCILLVVVCASSLIDARAQHNFKPYIPPNGLSLPKYNFKPPPYQLSLPKYNFKPPPYQLSLPKYNFKPRKPIIRLPSRFKIGPDGIGYKHRYGTTSINGKLNPQQVRLTHQFNNGWKLGGYYGTGNGGNGGFKLNIPIRGKK